LMQRVDDGAEQRLRAGRQDDVVHVQKQVRSGGTAVEDEERRVAP
jgi:hypothetical protein